MNIDIPLEELRLAMPWGYIAAKAWGFPNDKHVLVAHGILDNAGAFDLLIPLLPRGFYYVCIDLPGHGFSSYFPTGAPLDHFQYVFAIRRVLDSLKWDRCIYMGHSFGALLGLIHSTLYPEEIEKLIFLDIDSAIPVADKELIDCIRYTQNYVIKLEENKNTPVKLYTKEQAIKAVKDMRYSILSNAAAEAMIKRSVTKVGDKYKFNRDPRLSTGAFPLLNDEQHAAILEQLKTPVFVIMSSELALGSNEIPHPTKINRKNRKNKFVIVEGDHDVHMSYPERVAPHICHFLGNLKSAL